MKQKFLIPTYYAPTSVYKWWRIARACRIADITCIINPNSGPGSSVDPLWTNRIRRLRNAGAKLIGYVATGYGVRDPDMVLQDIENWYDFYPDIQGIFFDEVQPAPSTAQLTFYTSYVDAVRVIDADSFVVGNPGINTVEPYISTVGFDTIVIYEDVGKHYTENEQSGWNFNYRADRFADMVYECNRMAEAFYYSTRFRHARYMFITSIGRQNPWIEPPFYFERMVNL